jgi:peptidoglycan/LPS O-acetylase OafA/YrhL
MSLKYSRIIEPLFVTSIIIVFVSLPRVRESLGYANAAGWESLLHLSTIFLLLITTRHSMIAKKLLGSSIGTFLGAISYSVYLLHLPLLKVLELIGFRSLLGAPLALITFLFLTTIASWISYRIIELAT